MKGTVKTLVYIPFTGWQAIADYFFISLLIMINAPEHLVESTLHAMSTYMGKVGLLPITDEISLLINLNGGA